jgi:NhaA family Na+:H+ antiporter
MRRLTLDYLKTETGSGLALAAVAAAALGVANSGLGAEYFGQLARPVPVQIGAFEETESLADWIRILLMPVFFLVLGMELKFELLRGELSNLRGMAAPALAAIGGLIGPIVVYFAVTRGAAPWTWATGAATDGAAALAALSIAGPRLAHSLKVLLISVALADNLVATSLAAVLTNEPFHLGLLAAAGAVLALLALLSRWRRAPFLFYAAGFTLVWGLTLASGVDPALAGVACAFTVPVGARRAGQESTLKYFMESLHPYVAFVVLPLFVFSAAGVAFRDLRWPDLAAPAPLGVALALALGKPLGVLALCGGAIALKLVRRPMGYTWSGLVGVALLCGIGFSVSYYLAEIDPRADAGQAHAAVRATVFIGSALAALAGIGFLTLTQPKEAPRVSRARRG